MKKYKSTLPVTIILLLFFPVSILLQFGCNTTEPLEDKHETTISGKVYEKREAGVFPSSDAKVALFIENDSLSTYTDADGFFEFHIRDTLQPIMLRINKKNYKGIDTVITFTEDLYYEFFIEELVLYLPLKESNMWQYEAYSLHTFDDYSEIRDGIETWTVIHYHVRTQRGALQCEFNGTQYTLYSRTGERDTIKIHVSDLYNFEIENNNIFFNRSDTPERKPTVFRRFISASLRDGYRVYYPESAPEVIDTAYGDRNPDVEFKLERGVGFREIRVKQYGGISSTEARYKLQDFQFNR